MSRNGGRLEYKAIKSLHLVNCSESSEDQIEKEGLKKKKEKEGLKNGQRKKITYKNNNYTNIRLLSNRSKRTMK